MVLISIEETGSCLAGAATATGSGSPPVSAPRPIPRRLIPDMISPFSLSERRRADVTPAFSLYHRWGSFAVIIFPAIGGRDRATHLLCTIMRNIRTLATATYGDITRRPLYYILLFT